MKVKKRECIGHVQKRVGYRLRELKKRVKVLGGRGELTKRIIDKLQNYFGIAIRSNVGNLEGMEQSVLASIFHNHIIQLTAQRGLKAGVLPKETKPMALNCTSLVLVCLLKLSNM